MNFQNIEYFLAVVEYGNFTKAAQSLYISQQSLSENIHRLEEEIGTPLLNRGRTLTLTPAGECFVSGGRKILSTQDKMLREIAAVSNTSRSKIVIGVEPFDLPPFLPEVLSRFAKAYPEYDVTINPPHSPDTADLTFCSGEPEKSLEVISLIPKDPYVLVVSRSFAAQTFGSDWAAVEKALIRDRSVSGLEKLPFLLLYQNKHLHPALEELFQKAGFTPAEAFQSEDAGLLCSLCSAGDGALIAPLDYCKRKFGAKMAEPGTSRGAPAASDLLCCYPLDGIAPVSLTLTYPKGKHLNQAEKRFADTVKKVLES